MRAFSDYQAMIDRYKTNDLSESQPTKGNIAGGLTTIEEKALGNLEKIGRKCRYIEVLEQCLGRKAQKILLPMQPGDVDITFAYIAKAGQLLNYKPATDMATGIKKFIAWYNAANIKG